MSARAVGTVLIGNQTVARSDIRRLPECALPLDDASWAVARASLERDGFVLIRGAFDADTIAKCRVAMLAQVRRRGGIDLAAAKERGDPALVACAPIARTADGKRLQAGWTTDALVRIAASVAPMMRRVLKNFSLSCLQSGRVVDYRDEDEAGWAKVGESAPVQAVFNGPNLCGIAKQLFSNHCNEVAGSIRKASRIELLPQYTWLRMKGRGDVTIEHADYYFFYRSTAAFTGIGSINCPPSPSKDILTCGECSGSVLDHSPHASEVPKSHKASWLQCSLCNHVAFHSQWYDARSMRTKTKSQKNCMNRAEFLLF